MQLLYNISLSLLKVSEEEQFFLQIHSERKQYATQLVIPPFFLCFQESRRAKDERFRVRASGVSDRRLSGLLQRDVGILRRHLRDCDPLCDLWKH